MTYDTLEQEIYSVSELNRQARLILEGSLPTLQVEGEISNFVAPHSGHWYFSLKDTNAQVRCAMFRPLNQQLSFVPQNGMHVIVKGRVSLYEGRGDFQLIAEKIQDAGEGKLRLAFEVLKKRLADMGLFDPIHKKTLPAFPKAIGIVTSATGAAVKDILNVLKRRCASIPIIIYPTLVQGELAATNIVQAIQIANARQECDVLILARGGGSLEDLWSFNEEIVAQAIFKSDLPIVTGVGHEIDYTIADFVADLRAPTPSAAAELVTFDKEELLSSLTHYRHHFLRYCKQQLHQLQQQLQWTTKHLHQQHPKQRLRERAQHLDLLEAELIRLQSKTHNENELNIHRLTTKLHQLNPIYTIKNLQQQLALALQSTESLTKQSLQRHQQNIASAAATLDALSPLSTLKRGFAIATRKKDQSILRDATLVAIDEEIDLKLTNGALVCKVLKKYLAD
jgi:exodeoxyribonuclease VII large subunit